MSKYTTEVRYICENASGLDESVGYNSINKVIQDAIPFVFDFDFPIFDESYRNVLCAKILKHNYTKEIGLETVGLWKLKLDTKLNEIMPYYNQLYKSQLLEFNPFYEVDLTRDYTKTGDGTDINNESVSTNDRTVVNSSDVENGRITDNGTITTDKEYKDTSVKDVVLSKDFTSLEEIEGRHQSSGTIDKTSKDEITSEITDEKWKLFSDTPQGGISNIGLEGNNYLTNATKETDKNNTETENNSTSKDETKDSGTTGSESEVTSEETTTGKDTVNNSGDENNSTNNTNINVSENTINKNLTDTKDGSRSLNATKNMMNLETYFERVKGKQGGTSYSKMLQEFRQTFLNIDMMILDDLYDLFMLVW